MQLELTAYGTSVRIVDASCELLRAGKMFRRLAFSTTLLGLSLSAIPVPCSAAQLGDVEHIIVIYLENHSFDNLFGFFPNADDECGPGIRLPTVTISPFAKNAFIS